MTVLPRCSIIPPYLLEALSASADPQVGRSARATLDRQARLRAERSQAATAQPRGAQRPGRDDGTRPRRSIYDAQQETTLPGALVRYEGADPADDVAANEAYAGLGHTWALFREAFARDSLDDKGLGLEASVHYGRRYINAFWNGTQMVFGDGDGVIFNRFTASIDVIGHELAHGVTQFTAGLNYADQSGALNESLSDAFGSLVKQHTLGQDAASADWLIGAELLAPGVHGKALRSMIKPGTAYDDPRLGTDPQPDRMSRFVDTPDDYGGVHINSGIPNRAFATLAITVGGNAWETPGQIWYDALVGDIKADCDFATFARLTLAAAKARYGTVSAESAAVANAWDTVEVKPAPARRRTRRTPPKTTQVNVRRTGGFAGLTTERTVRLADLPPGDAKAWQTLLASRELHTMAATAPVVPDSFCYGVSCRRPSVDVTIPEPSLRDEVRLLLDRTLAPDSGGPKSNRC